VEHSNGGGSFGFSAYFGHRDDDELFSTMALKNGWIVDSVIFRVPYAHGNSNAYVTESRIGTNSPYVKVHWWIEAFSSIEYKIAVNIKGPGGLVYK